MRDLTPNLFTAQAEYNLEPRIRITLSLAGETDIVLTGGYPQQSGDRIKKITHTEYPYSVTAKEVELDNSDGYFTDLDLKSWQAVVALGLNTSEGNEYSDTSPMRVTWQQFSSSPGVLSCYLILKGIPDLMDEDEASAAYLPDDADTTTVKSLIDQIAGATLACFNHCKAYTTDWETGYDAIVDTYQPKKSFRIYKGSSRLAALKRLIELSENVYRWSDDGKIHIFKPNDWGTDYDSEYSIDSGHAFFAKAYRQTLVIPNRVVVASEPDDDPAYLGTAETSDYDTLPDEVKKTKYVELTLESNAQATSIAEAILARAEFNAEQGSAAVPLNCGSELYDYIKVGALNDDDVYRTGNVGWLSRTWDADKETWEMVFGFGNPPVTASMRELYSALAKTAESQGGSFDRLYAKYAYVEELWADFINIVDPESGQVVTLASDGIIILDKIDDGVTYGRLRMTQLQAGYIKLTSQSVKDGEWYKESGIVLDAAMGISLYGGHIALRTFETVNEYDTWLALGNIDDLTGVQCYVGTDGKIYAGGGSVALDDSGIHLYGDFLSFYDANPNLVGAIYAVSNYLTIKSTWADSDIRIQSSITGGISIAAGQGAAEPTDGEILLDPTVAVRINTALIIPGEA